MAQKSEQKEKFYTAEEVARAVLKKAEELLKASKLVKANSSHEVEAGEEPNNDEAEAPEYLANADIEDSGAHGEKKQSKKPSMGGEAPAADKDGDGDVDQDDAMEAAEEKSGKDLDGDNEAGESEDHKSKIKAASKEKPESDDDKGTEEKIADASSEKDKKEDKKPPFAKSETEKCGEIKPSLKKFMLKRKMKKSGGPTSDQRQAEKLSGANPQPTPAAKIKEQPKLQMEKNKPVEKLMGIKPKAGC